MFTKWTSMRSRDSASALASCLNSLTRTSRSAASANSRSARDDNVCEFMMLASRIRRTSANGYCPPLGVMPAYISSIRAVPPWSHANDGGRVSRGLSEPHVGVLHAGGARGIFEPLPRRVLGADPQEGLAGSVDGELLAHSLAAERGRVRGRGRGRNPRGVWRGRV